MNRQLKNPCGITAGQYTSRPRNTQGTANRSREREAV